MPEAVFTDVPTPAIVIDADTVGRNLRRMADYVRTHRFNLRPHTKTHKSRMVGRLQIESGATGLTVAKPGEAAVMAEVSDDVLMAYPAVDPRRAAQLAELAKGKTICVAIDSTTAADVISGAAQSAGSTVGVLVDLDVGLHRTGVQSPEAALTLAQYVARKPGLRLDGILFYPGHIGAGTPAQQSPLLAEVDALLAETIGQWAKSGLQAKIVSGGSTPTAFQSHLVKHVTELRPGTYVYNDMNCVRGDFGITLDDSAARIVCTVMSDAVPGQIVVDAGSTDLPGLAASARADVTIRVSVKFFTDANGNLPAVDAARGPTAGIDSAQAIAQWLVDGCNNSPDLRLRGYRYVLSENAVMLPASLAAWWGLDPRTGPAKANLEAAAIADPGGYSYRANAMNVYVNDFATSGSCSRPTNGTLTFLGRDLYLELLAHEAGHFFNLCHTQGCQCNGTTDANPGDVLCLTQPGDDLLGDTLTDLDSWNTPDQVAFMNFGLLYNDPGVSNAQRIQVDYVFQNLMSYHRGDPVPDGTPNPPANPYNLLTQDQLDVFLNAANSARRSQVTGTTWFVAPDGADEAGRGVNSSTPLGTVTGALNSVIGGDDVLLFRAGSYAAPPTRIATACTLRATRGPVTLTR